MAGHLGYIAEVEVKGEDRKYSGNYLCGAYGGDFETRDDRRFYIVAGTAAAGRLDLQFRDAGCIIMAICIVHFDSDAPLLLPDQVSFR